MFAVITFKWGYTKVTFMSQHIVYIVEINFNKLIHAQSRALFTPSTSIVCVCSVNTVSIQTCVLS